MSLSRRDLLATATAATALGLAGRAAAAPDANAAASALMDRIANELIDGNPVTATYLGMDTGKRAPLRAQLPDASPAATEGEAATSAARLKELNAIDRGKLTGAVAADVDATAYALQLGVEGGRFRFGDNSFSSVSQGGGSPYVVSQQGGAYGQVGEFLNAQHKVETRADAEAYLSRMEAFARVLDQETARVTADAGKGVIAPSFILDKTLAQMRGLRATPVAEAGIVTSLAERAKARGLEGDWTGRATRILEGRINPAMDRQIAAVEAVRARATTDAGVWKLPDGEAYYGFMLKVGTSTRMTADEIHAMGVEQNRAIQARMDVLLKGQGLTQGTVGQRMAALTADPKHLYPDSDAGRADLIAYLNSKIEAMRPRLAEVSKMKMAVPVMVKRVPPEIQDGAGLGYMNFAALDGSRPSIYYVNLKTMGNWPRYTLPSLTFHEAIPGHAWQGAYLAENKAPLIKSLLGFNAFIEGWALYAEQLASEMGFYADDPLGELGYLQAQQFRACRLIADTGLHAKRWTREQTIQFLTENTGRAGPAMQSETDRYICSPGQACGYKVGHSEIVRLRAKAKAALGPKFDVRDYNDVVVRSGGVPLTVLETVVDGWVTFAG